MTTLRLRPYLARERRGLVQVACYTVLALLPALLVGRLVASAVDAAADGRMGATLRWLGAFALVAVLGAVARMLQGRAGAALAMAVRRDLTEDVVEGALRAAVRDPYRRPPSGDGLVWQINRASELLTGLVYMAVMVGTVVASVVGLATLSPVLLLFVLPSLLASVVVLVHWRRVRARRLTAEMEQRERAADLVGATLEGVRDVVALGAHDRAAGDLTRSLEDVAERGVAADDANTAGTAVLSVVSSWVPLIAILAAAPWLVRNGWLSPGEVVGAAAYIAAGALQSLQYVRGVIDGLTYLRVNLDRLGAAMSEEEPANGPRAVPCDATVALRGLSFRYAPTAAPIVTGLDLVLPPGDHVAVVGPSGIGKSTLANLVAGLLSPTEGRVELGGVSVTALDHDTRRRTVAMVPQISYVFSGTVRENLAYLAPERTDADLLEAAGRFGLEGVLERLGGLDAPVSVTTSGLSEGERQLITLARVWLSPAPVIVLDEATCYLDPVAEARAERAFQARPGTTLLVVAHRMTSSLRAQRVLVMDGSEVRCGTHDELLATSELYAELHGLWAAAPA